MRQNFFKDIKRRKQILKEEKKKRIFLIINKNAFLSSKVRAKSSVKLSTNFSYHSRAKNYCFLTGRGRGILSKFGVSRMIFKELASFGYLNGIKKGSW